MPQRSCRGDQALARLKTRYPDLVYVMTGRVVSQQNCAIWRGGLGVLTASNDRFVSAASPPALSRARSAFAGPGGQRRCGVSGSLIGRGVRAGDRRRNGGTSGGGARQDRLPYRSTPQEFVTTLTWLLDDPCLRAEIGRMRKVDRQNFRDLAALRGMESHPAGLGGSETERSFSAESGACWYL